MAWFSLWLPREYLSGANYRARPTVMPKPSPSRNPGSEGIDRPPLFVAQFAEGD